MRYGSFHRAFRTQILNETFTNVSCSVGPELKKISSKPKTNETYKSFRDIGSLLNSQQGTCTTSVKGIRNKGNVVRHCLSNRPCTQKEKASPLLKNSAREKE